MIDLLYKQGRVHDKAQFLADIHAREELGNTGLKRGLHCHMRKAVQLLNPQWLLVLVAVVLNMALMTACHPNYFL